MDMLVKLDTEDNTPLTAPPSEGHDSMDSGVGCIYEKPIPAREACSSPRLKVFGVITSETQGATLPLINVHHSQNSFTNRTNSETEGDALSSSSAPDDPSKADPEYCTVSGVGYRCISFQRQQQLDREARTNSTSSARDELDLVGQRFADSPTSLASIHSLQTSGNAIGRERRPVGNNNYPSKSEALKGIKNGGTTVNSYSSSSDMSACCESPPPDNVANCTLSPKHKRALYHRKHYPPGPAKITALAPSGQCSSDCCGATSGQQVIMPATGHTPPGHNEAYQCPHYPGLPPELRVAAFEGGKCGEQSLHTTTINNTRPFDHNGNYNEQGSEKAPISRTSPISPSTAVRTAGEEACSSNNSRDCSPPPPPPYSPVKRLPSDPAGCASSGPIQGHSLVPDTPCHTSNGGRTYARLPVVRVELAKEDGDLVEQQCISHEDLSARPMASASRKTSFRRAQEVEEDDSHMEDQMGGAGGIQAIDLEELQRRRRTRQKKKQKFIKNILILSFSFVSLFSATSGLIILQSSLNRRMGVFGLCANFVAVAISCLLLPKALIQLLGCKWTIVGSMGCFILWIMSNLHPTWATLIPSAVVMGTGWAPLWTAQCTYFTVTGIEYAKWADNMPDVVIARMFGIFFMIFMTGKHNPYLLQVETYILVIF